MCTYLLETSKGKGGRAANLLYEKDFCSLFYSMTSWLARCICPRWSHWTAIWISHPCPPLGIQLLSAYLCNPATGHHTITSGVWLHVLPSLPSHFSVVLSSSPNTNCFEQHRFIPPVHLTRAWMQHHGPCRFLAPWTRKLWPALLQQEENECNLLFMYQCSGKS